MTDSAPKRQGLVLAALILVAAVANLNLAVANVALPDIGKAFSAGQTTLNLVAVGYSLGLATPNSFAAGLPVFRWRQRHQLGGSRWVRRSLQGAQGTLLKSLVA